MARTMGLAPPKRRADVRLLAALVCGAITLTASAPPVAAQRSPDAPEAASPRWFRADAGPATAQRHMVVAANPYAAEAGREVLRAGGSAVDAAIAVQLVLGLVEPQSSGLGGGAFLLHWDAATRTLASYDGREAAPAAARPHRFLRNGRPLPFREAMRSGLAVGVPGVVRLLELAHRAHGRLPWSGLFAPAIRLAESGFRVSPRLHALLAMEGADAFSPAARAYFFDGERKAWPVGHVLRNPDYARTLRRLAADGPEAFYTGPIAEAIVAAVAGAARSPGDMTLDDLAAYAAKQRPVVCAPYRGSRICSMGPPSSGGIAVGQALMLLEGFDLGRSPSSALAPGAVHLAGEALRLAFADRNWHVADSDFVAVPAGLLAPAYIDERRRLIDPERTLKRTYPGLPPGAARLARGHDASAEAAGTSHIAIVDGTGNAVSMTATIEAGFGSGLFAAGFLLNNQMTDFSFRPLDGDGRPIANRVEGGKRPRSSMAPTIVLDAGGDPWIVAGSPGGGRIIPYVLKSLIALIDWKLDPQAAADLPNFASTSETLEIEAPPLSLENLVWRWREAAAAIRLAIGVRALGRPTRFDEMTSGSHIIVRRRDGILEGGADRRREGVVRGD